MSGAGKPLHVTVLGAGPVGTASAALAASRGHHVTIWSPRGGGTRYIGAAIAVHGLLQGDFPVRVAADIGRAVEAADAILLMVPGHVQPMLLERLARVLNGRPAVLVTPPASLSPLLLARMLAPRGARAVLTIGADAWPLPIPMAERGGVWRFDSRQGTQELVDRRVGRNELDTIATLRSLVAAQFEYAAGAGRQGPWRAYARRFFSTPGQRDGLYWSSLPGEAESPLGPLVAQASQGGYGRGERGGEARPFHGYFFRILEGQGPSAPGGEHDYLVDGRMIGGFAMLAYPARHGSTGIQSFIVSHAGVVYQRDLGPGTREVAARITVFDPDAGWSVVQP